MITHNELIAEINTVLKTLCPDLEIEMFNDLHCPTTLRGISNLYPTVCIEITHREWFEHQYPEALVREQVLKSLMKTHKKLRIEIERIMYGH